MATPSSASEKVEKAGLDAKTKISNFLKDKEQEWTAVVEKRNGPLRLLDLPMDVLKEIVKEVAYSPFTLQSSRHKLMNSLGYAYK